MSYPTPPLTSSPKNSSSISGYETYSTTSRRYPTQDTMASQSQQYPPQYQQPYDSQNPLQDQAPLSQTYPQPFQDHNPQLPSYQPPHETPRIPAQESYFHSYSAPSSPAPAPRPASYTQPPSRRSSPLIRPSSVTGSNRRQRSPGGNPNYYSNSPIPFSVSPRPTPYNLNRPQPRPGFIRRCLNKIESWIRAFMRWSKRNPVKAGLLTFLPVMTIAAIAKVLRGIGKGLGLVEKGVGRPKPDRGGSSRGVKGEGKRNVRWNEEEDGEEGGWGWGLGSKGGPLQGMMKVMQMLV